MIAYRATVVVVDLATGTVDRTDEIASTPDIGESILRFFIGGEISPHSSMIVSRELWSDATASPFATYRCPSSYG